MRRVLPRKKKKKKKKKGEKNRYTYLSDGEEDRYPTPGSNRTGDDEPNRKERILPGEANDPEEKRRRDRDERNAAKSDVEGGDYNQCEKRRNSKHNTLERRDWNVVGREWTSLFKQSHEEKGRRRKRREKGCGRAHGGLRPPKRDEAPSIQRLCSSPGGPANEPAQHQFVRAHDQPSAGIHSPASRGQPPQHDRSTEAQAQQRYSRGTARAQHEHSANGSPQARQLLRVGWPIRRHRPGIHPEREANCGAPAY